VVVVALHRARLVLGLVIIRGYTILVFNQSHPGLLSLAIPLCRHNEYWWWSRSLLGKKRRVLRNSGPYTQRGHPSMGRHNEYWWWSRSPLGKKQRVLRNSGPVSGLLTYWPSQLKVLVAMGLAIWQTYVVC